MIELSKRMLRQERKEKEKILPVSYYEEASQEIREKVLALPTWQQAKTLMAYSSTPAEPDTRELISRAAAEGKQVLLPRCTDRTRMEAVPFTGWNRMQKNAYGILEPVGKSVPEKPELILVPCVAAAADGARLGHGNGYYDRFLQDQPGLRVCLCFQAFCFNSLPTEETDILMDLVITETDIYFRNTFHAGME